MLGMVLKELRKEKRMNQAELAKIMNVSQQTIGAWETERAIPGADTLERLADYFHVTTDYLLGRDGKEEENKDTTADIGKLAEKVIADLDSGSRVNFYGKPMDNESKSQMKIALTIALEQNKVKTDEN